MKTLEKNEKNRSNGKHWEDVLFKRAQMNGLLPKRNYLTARFIFKNKYKIMKSNLDLTIISPAGLVGFFDAKSFDKDYFTFSTINPDQVTTASEYNQWRVPSGFLVLFRTINKVVFFSGFEIKAGGPHFRFDHTMGLYLGRLENFDLKLLFQKNIDI